MLARRAQFARLWAIRPPALLQATRDTAQLIWQRPDSLRESGNVRRRRRAERIVRHLTSAFIARNGGVAIVPGN